MKISILGLGLSFCMIANGCLSIQVEMYPTTSSEAVSQEGENPQEVLQEVWKENSGRKYTAEASTSQDALQSDSKGSETGQTNDVSQNAESAANYEETDLSISSATDFWNGYAVIEQDRKFGLINEAGQIVIDPIYDQIGVFDETGSYAPIRVGMWNTTLTHKAILPWLLTALMKTLESFHKERPQFPSREPIAT